MTRRPRPRTGRVGAGEGGAGAWWASRSAMVEPMSATVELPMSSWSMKGDCSCGWCLTNCCLHRWQILRNVSHAMSCAPAPPRPAPPRRNSAAPQLIDERQHTLATRDSTSQKPCHRPPTQKACQQRRLRRHGLLSCCVFGRDAAEAPQPTSTSALPEVSRSVSRDADLVAPCPKFLARLSASCFHVYAIYGTAPVVRILPGCDPPAHAHAPVSHHANRVG